MAFDYSKMEVYDEALTFAMLADSTVRELPKGRGVLADQLTRASVSIVLNIAEGTGKWRPLDKARYYRSAAGSAAECAAIYDVLVVLQLAKREDADLAKKALEKISAMLGRLSLKMEERAKSEAGGE